MTQVQVAETANTTQWEVSYDGIEADFPPALAVIDLTRALKAGTDERSESGRHASSG